MSVGAADRDHGGPLVLAGNGHARVAGSRILTAASRSIDRRRVRRLILLTAVITDLLALGFAILVGHATLATFGDASARPGWWPLSALLVASLWLGVILQGAYRAQSAPLLPSGLHDMYSMARISPVAVLVAMTVSALVFNEDTNVLYALALAGPALLFVPLTRVIARGLLRRIRPLGATERILIVGSGHVARKIEARLAQAGESTVIGKIDDDPHGDDVTLGRLEDLSRHCREHRIDRVVVAFSRTPAQDLLDALQGVPDGIRVSVVPRLYESVSWRSAIEELHGVPLLRVPRRQDLMPARAAKRALDIVGASLGLVALAPLFAVVAAAIKVTSPGPVLFRQARSGQHRKTFYVVKFRTMREGADLERAQLAPLNEVDGPIFKMHEDPRVTSVGEFLRRTSLDELPQLLNVLRGEMSLVGPRPFPVEESAQISGRAATRFDVRPGLTGLWQISGRNLLTYDDLCHLDAVYVTCWSLSWDLRILLQTPMCVLQRRGVL